MFAPITREPRAHKLKPHPSFRIRYSAFLARVVPKTYIYLSREVAQISAVAKIPWPRRPLSLAGLGFHGVGGGEFPVPMRLTALGPGMQFAGFRNLGSARGTRHGNDLFQGKFLGFHQPIMQVSTHGKMLNFAHFRQFRKKIFPKLLLPTIS
jgi:hypothetical protein